MKILLIFPYKTGDNTTRWYPVEPLGILSLATYINKEMFGKGIEVRILDALFEGPDVCFKTRRGYRIGLPDDDIIRTLKDFEPDLVGISNNYTFNTIDVLELAALIKDTLPDSKVVLGGAHATIDHENLAQEECVDIVVRGEGEETLKDIISAMQTDSDFSSIQGITYKDERGLHVNEDRPLIPQIDVLPIPDRSLVPYENYLAKTHKHYFRTRNRPIGTIFTSRGCPYKCIFCSTQKVWRNKWRPRSAEKMFEEVELLVKKYGVREVAFQDDQLIGNKERMQEFCRIVIKSGIDVTFIAPPGISPVLIDDETIDLMKRAGFYRICFSIDVGTEAAKKYVRKPVKLEEIRKLIRTCNSKGLWTYGTFVIGFPFETVEDIQQTIKYAYNLKLDFVIFYIALPHMGSEFYDIYKKAGKIDENYIREGHLPNESMFGTNHMSPKELEAIRDKAANGYIRYHLRHFLNPIYLTTEFLPKIATWKRFLYLLQLIPALFPSRQK